MSSTSGSAQDAGGQEGAGSGLGGQSDMEGKSPAPSSHSMQVCSIKKYLSRYFEKSNDNNGNLLPTYFKFSLFIM